MLYYVLVNIKVFKIQKLHLFFLKHAYLFYVYSISWVLKRFHQWRSQKFSMEGVRVEAL